MNYRVFPKTDFLSPGKRTHMGKLMSVSDTIKLSIIFHPSNAPSIEFILRKTIHVSMWEKP